MMKHHHKWLHCLIIASLYLLPLSSSAYAGCSVNTTSINFGNYDVFSTTPDTGTGSITLSCTSKTNVTVAIGASSNSGTFNPRRMDHVVFGDSLDYNIYTSPAMVQVWGDGTHGTVTAYFSGVRSSNTPPIIVYGKIFPLQNVSAGSYNEQLVVTITY